MTPVVEDPAVDLHAPALLDVEVLSALRGLWLGRRIAPERTRQAVEDLADLPIERHATCISHRVMSLHANLSTYDATYVALAESLGASLLSLGCTTVPSRDMLDVPVETLTV